MEISKTKLDRIKLEQYYGENAVKMSLPNLEIWFSYKVVVAFRFFGDTLYIVKNHWTRTTGKHINFIKNNLEYDNAGLTPSSQYSMYEVESETEFALIFDLHWRKLINGN